jgi:hypothetical protein
LPLRGTLPGGFRRVSFPVMAMSRVIVPGAANRSVRTRLPACTTGSPQDCGKSAARTACQAGDMTNPAMGAGSQSARGKGMSTITIPRKDLTTDDVVSMLRDGLGPRYNVLPGKAMGLLGIQGPHEGSPDTIVVGIGGLSLDLLLNSLGVARKVRKVLASSD